MSEDDWLGVGSGPGLKTSSLGDGCGSLDGDDCGESLVVLSSMSPGTFPAWLGSLLSELLVDDCVLSSAGCWGWLVLLGEDGSPGESNWSDDEGGASIPSEEAGSLDWLEEEDDVEDCVLDDEEDD